MLSFTCIPTQVTGLTSRRVPSPGAFLGGSTRSGVLSLFCADGGDEGGATVAAHRNPTKANKGTLLVPSSRTRSFAMADAEDGRQATCEADFTNVPDPDEDDLDDLDGKFRACSPAPECQLTSHTHTQ